MNQLLNSMENIFDKFDFMPEPDGRFYKRYSIIQSLIAKGAERDLLNFKHDLSHAVRRYEQKLNGKNK